VGGQPFFWTEISIRIDLQAREALVAFLYDLGCSGIVSEGNRDEIIRFYLPLDQKLDHFKTSFAHFNQRIAEIFPDLQTPVLTINRIENQDWSENWRGFFKPDRITPNLVVFPAWEPVPKEMRAHVIRMDPGPAFGTGQHATTRLCLTAMEDIPSPSSKSMLDIGTGSGILSIYGARLNMGRIVGLDLDPEALEWAKQNIELNGVTEKIMLSAKPVEEWRETFNLIVANLTRDTILELLPHINRLLDKDGSIILSGILIDQERDIEAGLSTSSLRKEMVRFQGEWICLQAKKG
jgi:ribosomal protein L11 methyltransferase